MIRRFLVFALSAIGATVSHAQPSLPSSFQAKTIRSPEAADIFVRWGGRGSWNWEVNRSLKLGMKEDAGERCSRRRNRAGI